MSKKILSFLLALIMVLGMLPMGVFADTAPLENDDFKVVVSMEGLTLGQGFYAEPKAYTLDEINDILGPQYGTYTKENLTAGLATWAFLKDHNLSYDKTGSWTNDVYLSRIKGIDNKIIDIPEIITEKGGPSNENNLGNNDEWLGEFDYSQQSGWMVTVNDYMIDKGCGKWVLANSQNKGKYQSDLGNTYVVRWQFTLSGLGADLGTSGTGGAEPYFAGARKASLYAAYAESENEAKKAEAMKAMEKLTASQQEVDAAFSSLTTQTVTVKVAPKTVEVTFKKGGTELSSGVSDNGEVGNFHEYVLAVPAGEYSYTGKDGETNLGGEVFTVDGTNQTINLLRANIRYNGASLNQEGDYNFTLKNGEKYVILGDSYVSSGIRYTPTLLIAGAQHSGTVTLDSKRTDDYYVTSEGNFTNTPKKTDTSAANINLPISQYKIIRVTAPKEAQTTFYTQEKNYLVKKVTPDDSKEDTENGMVTYIFKGTAAHSNYQFRSMMNGKVTQAGYLKDGDNIVVDFDRDRNSDATMSYDDAGVLLNINEKNELNLATGNIFKLRAYRAAWQIINTTTGNQMIEPDFHYRILSGENVISIEPTNVSVKGEPYCSGNATGNWMNVTAIEPGTAVVAVYYDAIDVYGANPANASGYTHFKETDPSRYGIFAVKVGDDGTITWNPASHDGDWDAEFDTVYYSGEQGTFTFRPTESVTKVTVQNVNDLTLGDVKDVNASSDGSFAVPVTNGANIITASIGGKTDTMIVRAKKIGYKITNNTTGEFKENGAPAIKTGDSVTIHLDKLDMPIPKFSGIYNPGYMGTAKNAYDLNGITTLMSAGTQYDFADSPKSDITFTAHFAGINSLKGYVSLSSMGSDFGEHRKVNDDGVPANMNAAEKFGDFGELPAIEFEVADSGKDASYEDATAITSLTVKGANSTGYLTGFTNWTKAENGSSNWTADAATVATYAITANVKTKDYNNTLILRYWYDGEAVNTIPLSSGVTATVPVSDFKLDANKILNLQVEIAPLKETLGAAKTYTYIVYPGKDNLKYVHPVIKSLTAKADDQILAITPAVDTATLFYTLDVDGKDKITLEGEQLIKIYNTAVTADKSDQVVLTKFKNGEAMGDPITILEEGVPTNPNRSWTLPELDITGADTLKIVVTSYVDHLTKRTYSFKIENQKDIVLTDYKSILNTTLAKLVEKVPNPGFGTSAGEWTVFALARGEYSVPENYYKDYYSRVVEAVSEKDANLKKNGALSSTKSTENSRLIIALSSIGKNPSNVGNVNVLGAYDANGFDWIKTQGINGPIFALIALDTKNYPTADTTLRDQCINYILQNELSGGGWTLDGQTMNIDITAMALQALAKYRDNSNVQAAADRAFTALSKAQNADGYYLYNGEASSESISQVITALSAWKYDADIDDRFIKNGKSLLDILLSFYDEENGGFKHELVDEDVDGMATDQAAYALVSYDRFKSGKRALYDMTYGDLLVTLSLPEKIEKKMGNTFKAIVNISGPFDGYRALDGVMNIPECLDVVSVEMGTSVSGGNLNYEESNEENKLRFAYADLSLGTNIKLEASDYPAELMSVELRMAKDTNLTELMMSLEEMSFMRSSEESARDNLDTTMAYDTIQIVNGFTVTAYELYYGDGIDLIPADKKAVEIAVTGLETGTDLIYKDAENEGSNPVSFLYSEEITEKTGLNTYVTIVPVSMDLTKLLDPQNYMISINGDKADKVTFGDIDGNNIINAQDALYVVSFWLRQKQVNSDKLILTSNLNGDSRINTLDALAVVEIFVDGKEPRIINMASTMQNIKTEENTAPKTNEIEKIET